MKYMLQVRFTGADVTINSLPAHEQQAIFAEFEAIGRRSRRNRLQSTAPQRPYDCTTARPRPLTA
jgi:hypothetical protein